MTSSLRLTLVRTRFREAREIRFVQLKSGKFAYEWHQPPRSRALSEAALIPLESSGRRKPGKRTKM